MEDLLNEIDEKLTNRYIVLEGDADDGILYVKDRESDKHYSIRISECDD